VNQRALRNGLSVCAVTLCLAGNLSAAVTGIRGADVSWLPRMEAAGMRFYDDNGVQKDALQILKEHNVNAIRLRTFVNPSSDNCSGHNNKAELVAMARRAKDMGFRILIDFHYSDSWADPGKQNKPAAWASLSFEALMTQVYNYTLDVMNTLKAAGINPDWVQVGNETNNGMLWETGRASANMRNFAWLVNSGYDAVKASTGSPVIVHISNGYDNSLFRWIFDGLTNNGGKFDIIGMSLYPSTSDWQTLNNQTLSNMNDMRSRYGKPTMIVEVGMDASAGSTARSFIVDLMNKVNSAQGMGVFYWEPQAYNWCGYSKGAWNTNGRPTVAIDAFLDGSSTPTPTARPRATPTPRTTPRPTATPRATATPTTAPGTSFALANVNSGKCLDVWAWSTADGGVISQYSCTGGTNQRWTAEDMGSGYVRLRSAHSGKCLDIASSSTADGTQLQQWACGSGQNQQFQMTDTGSGQYRLTPRHSGKAIDVANCSTADGAKVQQWTWLNNNCQKFRRQ
jgi:arabinogalactan endo-1,4-beta-galactosidase